MELEDCTLLRDEPVDSGSINRCIDNIYFYMNEVSPDDDGETSENYPESPFYKDGVDNALTGSAEYSKYALSQMSTSGFGVVRRLYSGPLNVGGYKSESLSTLAHSGFYQYDSATVENEFVPTVQSLYSGAYPLVFASLLGDEGATVVANGTCTIPSTYLPTVKYTSYLLCSGKGVSFGTITFDRVNGNVQKCGMRIDVVRDLIHLDNVGKVTFVSVANGYASGVRRISEDLDMVEDVCQCGVTFLDRDKTEIYVDNITKNDGGDVLRVENSTGRILGVAEDAEYGSCVELDNTTYELCFFVMFDYSLPSVEFTNDAVGLGIGAAKVNYAKFMQSVMELSGSPMALPSFVSLDNYTMAETAATDSEDNVVNVQYCFDGCSNALFTSLCHMSSKTRIADYCFRNCTSADFAALSTVSLNHLRTGVSMFEGCRSSKFAALASVEMANSVSVNGMFSGCTNATFDKLKTICVNGSASKMFYGCRSASFSILEALTGGYRDITDMFVGCNSATFDNLEVLSSSRNGTVSSNEAFMDDVLATFDSLSAMTFGKGGYYAVSMFEGCTNATFKSLESIGTDGVSEVVNGERMFKDCKNATFEKLEGVGSSLTNGRQMFYGCSKSKLNLDYVNSDNSEEMFSGCGSVNIKKLSPSGGVVFAEKMFGDVGSCTISEVVCSIDDGNHMFAESDNVKIDGGLDAFNVAKDSSHMFENVKNLTLHVMSDASTGCADNCDYMFHNVTSKTAFENSSRCVVNRNSHTANYMYAIDDCDESSDELFNVIPSSNYFSIFNYKVGDVTRPAISESTLTSTDGMFENRLFRNGTQGMFWSKYQDYMLQVPSSVESANRMYRDCALEFPNDYIRLAIPSSLKYANYMFQHVNSGNNNVQYLLCTYGDDYRNGTIYFSDSLHDNHASWFEGAKFANDATSSYGIVLSVKNLTSDYFYNSNFDFATIAGIEDRSGRYWTGDSKDYRFFVGMGSSRRDVNFRNLTSDVTQWFSEGAEFNSLLAPYAGVGKAATMNLVLTSLGKARGTNVPRAAMATYNREIDNLVKYTQGEHFKRMPSFDGDNMACMFSPFLLAAFSETKTYYNSTHPEYTNGYSAMSLRIYGNTIADAINSDRRRTFTSNYNYLNTTFENLTSIDTVNMPFAFYGLKNATFGKLRRISGSMSNGSLAFADCIGATFDSLSSIEITSNFTSSNFTANSFVDNTQNWHSHFDRMFYGCYNATFPKLDTLSITQSTERTLVLAKMFYYTGLSGIPSIEIKCGGSINANYFKCRRYIPNSQLDKSAIYILDGSLSSQTITAAANCIYFIASGDKTAKSTSCEIFLPVGVKCASLGFSGNPYNAKDTFTITCFEYPSYTSVGSITATQNTLSSSVKKFTFDSADYGLSHVVRIDFNKTSASAERAQTALTSISTTSTDGRRKYNNFYQRDGLCTIATTAALTVSSGYVACDKPSELASRTVNIDSGGLSYLRHMLQHSTANASNVSIHSKRDVDASGMFYNSNISFDTMAIDSNSGKVCVYGMFEGCSSSTFDKATNFEVSEDRFSTVASGFENDGAKYMLSGCNSATLSCLNTFYLPEDCTSGRNGYAGVFSDCNSLNLNSLKASSTNLQTLAYNGERTDGTVLFAGLKNVGVSPTRSAVIDSNSGIDKDILYAMTWSGNTSSTPDGWTDALIDGNVRFAGTDYLSCGKSNDSGNPYVSSFKDCSTTLMWCSSCKGNSVVSSEICVSGFGNNLSSGYIDLWWNGQLSGALSSYDTSGYGLSAARLYGSSWTAIASNEQISTEESKLVTLKITSNLSSGLHLLFTDGYALTSKSYSTSNYCWHRPIMLGGLSLRHTTTEYEDIYEAVDSILFTFNGETDSNGMTTADNCAVIDTGVEPDEDTTVEMKCMSNGNVNDAMFGCATFTLSAQSADDYAFVAKASTSDGVVAVGATRLNAIGGKTGGSGHWATAGRRYCTVAYEIHPMKPRIGFKDIRKHLDTNIDIGFSELGKRVHAYNACTDAGNRPTITIGAAKIYEKGKLVGYYRPCSWLRVFDCVIRKRGVVVAHLVPVRHDSNNGIGLYDVVGGKFHGNEGGVTKSLSATDFSDTYVI